MPRAKRRPQGHVHELGVGPGELRAKGRRLTRQRQLIWETLAAEPEQHLSAEDVVERVRTQLPDVNTSTIYRTLELLVTEGLLLRTDLGGDRAYFELSHEHSHHHLVCESCGAVLHVHDEELGDLRRRIESTTGFAVGSGEITLFGLCAECARLRVQHAAPAGGAARLDEARPERNEDDADDDRDDEAEEAADQ